MRATRYVCHGALLGILGICLSLLAVGLHPPRAPAQPRAGGDRRAVAVRPASNVEAVACQPPFGSFGGSVWPPACWRPYTSGSPFNRPIPANPKVAPNSAAIMERMFRDIPQGPNPQPGHITANTYGNSGEPTYYSRASDPFFKIECTDFGGGCPVDAAHLPKGIQIPAGAVPE